MVIRKTLLICLFLLVLPIVNSQVPEIEFNKTIDAGNTGGIVRQTSDNGYIIIASKNIGNDKDILLIKTDFNGNPQWNKTFGGSDSDIAYSIQQTSDSGYIMAGHRFSEGVGGFRLIKTDSAGNLEWDKSYGYLGNDFAFSVYQTSDGGYISTGLTHSLDSDGDFWLIKTGNNGNELWNKTFGGSDSDSANSAQQTSDGGSILAGSTYSFGGGLRDAWIIKTDNNGNELWNKTFHDSGFESAVSAQQTSDGGYIFVGDKYSSGNDGIWLVKIDTNGNQQWNRTFGNSQDDIPSSVQQTSDDGYLIGGTTSLGAPNYNDFWLIKTDSNGNEEWNKKFDSSGSDIATSAQQTSDDGYFIGGGSMSVTTGKLNIWLIKLKPENSTGSGSGGVNDTAPSNITIANPLNGSTITTTSTWLNVTTDEVASCTYSQHKCPTSKPMLACEIDPVTNISTNNETFHFKEISLQSGYTYTIDVNCADNFSNVNTKSVTFYVAFPQPGGGGGGGGGPTNVSNITVSKGFINLIFPENNSVVSDNSVWLSIFTNKYGNCNYSLDSSVFTGLQEAEETTITLPPGIVVEGDAWQVQTSNHLELSEDDSSSDTIETLRNITTYIGKNELKALASGSVTNSKTTSPYNQYIYLLGPGTNTALDAGYVIYTEADDDVTADFLYFKSGKEIARYLLEFTTALESDVDDSSGSASTTGLFLTDYQDVDINLFGKRYTIVSAKRATTNGNSVVLTLLGGAAKDTLLEKQTKTYTINGVDYEVTLNFVDADEAQFVINGPNNKKNEGW